MHPRSFEESSVFVSCKERLAVLIENLAFSQRFCKGQHIFIHFSDMYADSFFIGVLRSRIGIEASCLPFFQLSAPDTTQIHICSTIIIDKYRRIDTKASRYIIWFGCKWTGGTLTGSNTYTEDAIFILCRKIEIICAVLICGIGCPHLLANPRNIFHMKNLSVVYYRCIDVIH